MTYKHISFDESPVMRELARRAVASGKVEIKPVDKHGLMATGDLFMDLVSLADGLREKGYVKEAEELEQKMFAYKKAAGEYSPELDLAHPDGDFEVNPENPASDQLGEIETLESEHNKIVEVATKSAQKKISEIVKAAEYILKVGQQADEINMSSVQQDEPNASFQQSELSVKPSEPSVLPQDLKREQVRKGAVKSENHPATVINKETSDLKARVNSNASSFLSEVQKIGFSDKLSICNDTGKLVIYSKFVSKQDPKYLSNWLERYIVAFDGQPGAFDGQFPPGILYNKLKSFWPPSGLGFGIGLDSFGNFRTFVKHLLSPEHVKYIDGILNKFSDENDINLSEKREIFSSPIRINSAIKEITYYIIKMLQTEYNQFFANFDSANAILQGFYKDSLDKLNNINLVVSKIPNIDESETTLAPINSILVEQLDVVKYVLGKPWDSEDEKNIEAAFKIEKPLVTYVNDINFAINKTITVISQNPITTDDKIVGKAPGSKNGKPISLLTTVKAIHDKLSEYKEKYKTNKKAVDWANSELSNFATLYSILQNGERTWGELLNGTGEIPGIKTVFKDPANTIEEFTNSINAAYEQVKNAQSSDFRLTKVALSPPTTTNKSDQQVATAKPGQQQGAGQTRYSSVSKEESDAVQKMQLAMFTLAQEITKDSKSFPKNKGNLTKLINVGKGKTKPEPDGGWGSNTKEALQVVQSLISEWNAEHADAVISGNITVGPMIGKGGQAVTTANSNTEIINSLIIAAFGEGAIKGGTANKAKTSSQVLDKLYQGIISTIGKGITVEDNIDYTNAGPSPIKRTWKVEGDDSLTIPVTVENLSSLTNFYNFLVKNGAPVSKAPNADPMQIGTKGISSIRLKNYLMFFANRAKWLYEVVISDEKEQEVLKQKAKAYHGYVRNLYNQFDALYKANHETALITEDMIAGAAAQQAGIAPGQRGSAGNQQGQAGTGQGGQQGAFYKAKGQSSDGSDTNMPGGDAQDDQPIDTTNGTINLGSKFLTQLAGLINYPTLDLDVFEQSTIEDLARGFASVNLNTQYHTQLQQNAIINAGLEGARRLEGQDTWQAKDPQTGRQTQVENIQEYRTAYNALLRNAPMARLRKLFENLSTALNAAAQNWLMEKKSKGTDKQTLSTYSRAMQAWAQRWNRAINQKVNYMNNI